MMLLAVRGLALVAAGHAGGYRVDNGDMLQNTIRHLRFPPGHPWQY